MRQLVVIHGGDSFLKKRDYQRFLRSIKITAASLRPRTGWKANLQADLGRGWRVLRPTMPNNMNARYEDWKIWLEKYRPFIQTNAVFVGHSQGGIFLARYFSERVWPKKVQALILVAPPHNRTKGIGDFRLRQPLKKLSRQVKKIVIFHSTDDPIVPFTELAAYQRALPHAELHILHGQGHITGPHFPELVRCLKTLQ